MREILAEAEPAGFRDALLDKTLHLVRRRRRLKRFRQSAVTLAAVAVGAFLASRMKSSDQEAVASHTPAYATVRTASLPALAVVHTQRLDQYWVVASTMGAEVVRTTVISGRFRTIGDEELLALASPRTAALVRMGPTSEKLIFTNPSEPADYPAN